MAVNLNDGPGTRSLRIVGLDLSLTSTGMSDGLTYRSIQTSPERVLEARLTRIMEEVIWFVAGGRQSDTDLCVIEAPAWSRSGPARHLRVARARDACQWPPETRCRASREPSGRPC